MTLKTFARVAVAAMAALLLLVSRAHAGPTDLYGAFPRGMATANTGTASAEDSSAALYNPAGIALAGQTGLVELQLGYAYGLPRMYLNRAQNAAGSPQAVLPPGEGWVTLAATMPLGGKIKDRASFGFSFYLPQNNLIQVQELDPTTPQWLRYQVDPDRLVLAIGLGVRVTDWLAVGIGAQVLASFSGSVNFNVDIANRDVTSRDLDFQLAPGASPVAGITIMPHPAWRFAIVYKGALQLKVDMPNNIDISGLGIALGVTGSVLYSPQEIAVGTQFAPTSRLKLAVDLKYDFWSQAPFPGLSVAVTPTGAIATGLGLDKLGFTTNDANPNFSNTLTPSASVEYLFPSTGITLRGGYSYRPPYAPQQVGTTNFLDAVAHVVGLGATFQFRDPLDLFSRPLMFDLAAQFQYNQPVTITKAETGDPVGNYTYGGYVVAFGGSFRYDF